MRLMIFNRQGLEIEFRSLMKIDSPLQLSVCHGIGAKCNMHPVVKEEVWPNCTGILNGQNQLIISSPYAERNATKMQHPIKHEQIVIAARK